MRRGWVVNALLALAVSALGLFVAYRPGSDAPTAHRLSRLEATSAQRIALERKGDPRVVIERRRGGWYITAPLEARADPFQVERLLAILEATARHRLPVHDLARYELEAPLTRLAIDGESFSFGAVNSVTREQYVLAGETVYAVSPRYGAMIPTNLSQLVGKQLFAEGEVPVRLEFRDFTVARESDGWRVSPAREHMSQDDVQRWLDAWRHASALRAEASSGDKPSETIRIALENGKRVQIDVVQTAPELVLARSDEKIRYHFPAQTAKRLLASPAAHP